MMISSPNYDHLAHLKIPLENILTATNNFADENIVTEYSYQGQLLLSGELINILVLRLEKELDDEAEQMIWMEVSLLSSLKHNNLVSLVGFCDENDEAKILIYKLEFTGALINYLSDPLLTWVRRLEICVGVAHALNYIYYDESRDFSVIHHKISSSSIQLDEDSWEPKLCEFTRSMKIKASERRHSFNTNKVLSTDGYTDPTYIETKCLNHKSDMYSFGIVLFELLCGRGSIIDDDYNKYLAPVAVTHYRQKKLNEIIDWHLWKQMDSQSLNIFAEIAYDCLNEERSKRPDIDEIVLRLEKALELARENMPTMSLRIHDLAHLRMPLRKILSATKNFETEDVLANGFAKEYTGQLTWSGELIRITVRRFNKDRDEMFWTEVSMLSSLKHQNLVSLIGFCDENGEKIIITRREKKGSLRNYVSYSMLLTWVQRLEISVGLANVLSYIHYDETRDFSVIHGGISSCSVLLNDNYEPKLSLFEKSMRIEASQRHHSFHNSEVWNMYKDTTYKKTKSVNHKTDMYSFGIVLIELLCGKQSIIAKDGDRYLAPADIRLYKEKKLNEIIDWDLWKQIDSLSFEILGEVAYECLNEERSQRPNIDEIVPRLQKALEVARENRPIMSSRDEFAHLKIPLEDILSATNNFDEENCISTSGIAKKYEGQILWSGELIKIDARRLNKERDEDDEQNFWMEFSMLCTLKHKNLVSIVGFCDENDEKVIIYRHETRGELDEYLSDPILLTWVQRLKISVGLGQALSYIHYDEPRDFSVIHRNIDSSTVLLNDDLEPKLCDFERSMKIKASQRHQSFHMNLLSYTTGYVDPTYIETGNVDHKSDVYSFGIVLFELLCCRKSIIDDEDDNHLAPLAITDDREKKLSDIIHPELWKQMDLDSFNMFAEIAYECIDEERSGRPNIDDIVPRLEKALELQLKRENYDNSIVDGRSSFIHNKVSNVSPPPSLSPAEPSASPLKTPISSSTLMQQSSPSES